MHAAFVPEITLVDPVLLVRRRPRLYLRHFPARSDELAWQLALAPICAGSPLVTIEAHQEWWVVGSSAPWLTMCGSDTVDPALVLAGETHLRPIGQMLRPEVYLAAFADTIWFRSGRQPIRSARGSSPPPRDLPVLSDPGRFDEAVAFSMTGRSHDSDAPPHAHPTFYRLEVPRTGSGFVRRLRHRANEVWGPGGPDEECLAWWQASCLLALGCRAIEVRRDTPWWIILSKDRDFLHAQEDDVSLASIFTSVVQTPPGSLLTHRTEPMLSAFASDVIGKTSRGSAQRLKGRRMVSDEVIARLPPCREWVAFRPKSSSDQLQAPRQEELPN